MAFVGEGHYGVLRLDEKIIGGFLQWGIGVTVAKKITDAKWRATARHWWLLEQVQDNKCEASFYKIQDDNAILIAKENIMFVCGSKEKNKLITSMFEMNKYEDK